MSEPQVPIGVYVGEAEPGFRIGKVTVIWWELSPDDNADDLDYQAHHQLEVTCEFWAGDEGTMEYPDHWE